jgi:hypothetical protein
MCVKGENLSKVGRGFKPNLPVTAAVNPDGRLGEGRADAVAAADPLESLQFLPEVQP